MQSAIGFQPDVRHPVSFNQFLNHTATRLGLKLWTSLHTLVWAVKLSCTGQPRLTRSCLQWIIHMSPEVPKPHKLVLKMELVFLVLKEIKILPSEFIKNLWDL